MVGEGKMRYASGHERIGTMDNDEWTGDAVYLEVVYVIKLHTLAMLSLINRLYLQRHPHGTLKWSEYWVNGTYR